ncbi:MAG: AsnC family transcriptional regulator [Halobacteriales archaeon]
MAERSKPDDVDLRIIELLSEDGRMAYSDIAEDVGLSAPAVSDRIDKLEEHGVIRGFTADVDRSKLRDVTPLLVELRTKPGEERDVYTAARQVEGARHVFLTSGGRVVLHVEASSTAVDDRLNDAVDLDLVRSYDVGLLRDYSKKDGVAASGFALDCAVCGNPVEDGGSVEKVDGETLAFCCPSCRSKYEEDYRRLSENA